ncbi:MAG: TetR/AcrR family transcriptional regulator [Bacteroidales bacterium]|nr:TetR/AcrR family transcriptional regulator [Bacteroidales bacterium]
MATENGRQKVVETAAEMFNSRGCRAVTMDSIAQVLHISKRTLYEMFENKEALLAECLKMAHDEVERRRRMAAERVKEPLLLVLYMMRVNASIDRRFDCMVHDAELYYPEIHDLYFKQHTEQFRKLVEHGLDYAESKGYLRAGVDKRMVAEIVVRMVQNYRRSDIEDTSQFLRQMSEVGFTFLRGLMSAQTIIDYEAREVQMGEALAKLEEEWDKQ